MASTVSSTQKQIGRYRTVTELDALFRQVGFRKVEAWPRFGGRRYRRVPLGLVKAVESLLERLPTRLQHRLGRAPIIRNLVSAPLRAIK